MSSMIRKTKSAPAAVETTSKRRRFFKGNKKAKTEEATKLRSTASLTIMGWSATATERVTIALAQVQEKADHIWIRVRYKCFACSNCIHYFRRRAARKAAEQATTRATEIRNQKEAAAISKAAKKRLQISDAKIMKRAAKREEDEKASLLA